MPRAKQLDYDDDALCTELASAEHTYAEIAKMFGISESLVASIATGARRPELQQKIQAFVEGQLQGARRRGARAAGKAMEKLENLLDCQEHETARKAACDILKWTLGDPGKTVVTMTQSQGQVQAQPQDIDIFFNVGPDQEVDAEPIDLPLPPGIRQPGSREIR